MIGLAAPLLPERRLGLQPDVWQILHMDGTHTVGFRQVCDLAAVITNFSNLSSRSQVMALASSPPLKEWAFSPKQRNSAHLTLMSRRTCAVLFSCSDLMDGYQLGVFGISTLQLLIKTR